jgi:hypothetical protein
MDEKLEAEWPCKKSFWLVPFEEIRKDMVAVACPVALAMRNMSGPFFVTMNCTCISMMFSLC